MCSYSCFKVRNAWCSFILISLKVFFTEREERGEEEEKGEEKGEREGERRGEKEGEDEGEGEERRGEK